LPALPLGVEDENSIISRGPLGDMGQRRFGRMKTN
jgi:hypothetical protein